MSEIKKPFDYLASLMEDAGLKEKEKTQTPKNPLDELGEEVLNNSKEDINFSTKLRTSNEKLKNLQKQKGESKDKQEKLKIQEEINSVNREKNRLIRFGAVSKQKIPGIENLEKEDVDNIGAKKLLQIEKEKKGFLSSAFSYKQTQDKDGNTIEEPITNPSDIKEGDKILIDFGKNRGANSKIGAGDILPPSITIIKITDNKGNEFVGTRDIAGNKVGYYDKNNKYIPIYNGYKIYIPKDEDLIKSPFEEYKIKKTKISDKNEISNLEALENKSRNEYITQVEANEKIEKISDIVSEIGNEIGTTQSYKERLEKIIAKANEYKINKLKYSEDELNLVIKRLSKTLEIIGNKEFNFDWDSYKLSISKVESCGLYTARNDNLGKKKGISSEKWAFGKYQFTTETLRGFGVDLGRPPLENNIQDFLNNHLLQEEIMDKYMIQVLQKKILPNSKIMQKVADGNKDIPYYLALTHIGGPGALIKSSKTDWLGTSAEKYASIVSDNCKS
ncbi:MAG: hypothetical protein PHZ26_01805 [Candidatus Gracilibacteria bacterium]|nr:hypothetical protein [Candidatus Gracilibacteria bacterium]MDD2908469.1 hypothetical protein [Candidatus Gracilibacteria bacterium]